MAAAHDILRQIPVRVHPFEPRPDREGCCRILVPVFGKGPAGRFLRWLTTRDVHKVNLDDLGSLVYSLCDGTRTVEHIAVEVRSRHGAQSEPLEERLELFLRQLFRRGFITFAADRMSEHADVQT